MKSTITPHAERSRALQTATALHVHAKAIPFGDTDAATIVYTPRYADYCMEAAETWFRDCLDYDWYRINTELGSGTPVVHLEIDFKASLRAGDELRIEVRVERLGAKSVTLSLRGVTGADRATQAFEARFVFCFTSERAGGAIPIPDAQRRLIEDYMNRVAA